MKCDFFLHVFKQLLKECSEHEPEIICSNFAAGEDLVPEPADEMAE